MTKVKNLIKSAFKSILNIPTPYVLTSVVIISLIILVLAQGNAQLSGIIGLLILGGLFYLQIKLGSIVIKSLFSGFTILYTISIYTYLTIELHGLVVQPFLLTVATVTSFLAMTYISHNLSLRSRPLWTAVLAIVAVSVKSGILISGYSYSIAEIIGLNIIVMYSVIWYFWANNSKKSKIVKPFDVEEKVVDNFKYIYINERINMSDKKWLNKSKKLDNANPYIYTEVMKALESKLTLIIISKLATDKTYDVGYVNYNSKEIPYLYIEAKTDVYINDIINQFKQEILKV